MSLRSKGLWFQVLFLIGIQSARSASEAVLAERGQLKMPLIVGADASPRVRAAAESLSATLSRMTGAEAPALEMGDGAAGLVVGLASDFDALPFEAAFNAGPFEREVYRLQTAENGVWLLGATELAVEHAVWDFLYRLGFRQYFPGSVWEIVPSRPEIRVALDVLEQPDFLARRIWYNWGMNWGYNVQPYREWCARNRMAQGFQLNSGHAYGGILAANRAAFDANPDYYALVDGERRHRGGDTKFCIANPGLRQLVVTHAERQVARNPALDSISMDPSDGDLWCECEDCAALGSVSDRVLTLANDVAAAINALGLGEKYVGIYAYNRHSPPPSIEAHPNVIVSVATSFLRGGYSLDQIIEGWRSRGATLGIYDYFSVIAWDWNLPRRARAARPSYIRDSLTKFHAQGARFHDAESGDAWGPYGLGYYIASRLMWDLDEADRIEALIDDFIRNAFGPAEAPMREFYHLIAQDTARRSNADLVARMYRHLDAAYALAATDEAVLRRLDDLVKYTRYVELYAAFADATGDAHDRRRDDVVRHAYRMRESMMVHAYGFWARTVRQAAAHQPDHPLKDDRPIEREELRDWMAQGIESFEPVEMGFEALEFSREVVPAREALNLPEVAPGHFPRQAQDRQNYSLWLPEAGTLAIDVTVQHVWNLRPHRIELHSPLEVSVEAVAVNTDVRPDGQTYRVELPTPYDGLHRLEVRDGGDYTRVNWPEDLAVSVEVGSDSPGLGNQFRGIWTLYCYVPAGTKVVGGWAARVANWAPRVSGTLRDGDGVVRHDFGEAGEGWFSVPVPEGQDGRVWMFDQNHGIRQLMTIPPYLARSTDDLLLPREIVARDRKGD